MKKNRKGDKKLPTEYQTQCAFFLWIQTMVHIHPGFAYFHHSPNEGRMGDDRRWGAKRRALGLKKGFPDVICLYPSNGYHGLCVEFKRKPNKATKDQLMWIAKLKKVGYAAGVCYSLDQAIKIVQAYFGIKNHD